MTTQFIFWFLSACLLSLTPVRAEDASAPPAANAFTRYEQRTLNAALRTAARRNDLAGVRESLKKGAQVDGASADGLTALMYASRRCNPDIAQLLLRAGADPGATNKRGRTPLILAVRSQCLRVVKWYLRHPAINVLHRDGFGKRAEDYARSATELEVDGPTFKMLHLIQGASKLAKMNRAKVTRAPASTSR